MEAKRVPGDAVWQCALTPVADQGKRTQSGIPFLPLCPQVREMKSRIMYIELKSGQGHEGHDDSGPARIGRVTFSQTGRTIHYRGHKFRTFRGFCGNYRDVETGDEYWISGPKKNGEDRHPVGSGPVVIDEDVREEYWMGIRKQPENTLRKLA